MPSPTARHVTELRRVATMTGFGFSLRTFATVVLFADLYAGSAGATRPTSAAARPTPSTKIKPLGRTLPYEKGDIPPEGYRIERSWQSYLVIPSATVLG